MILEHVARSTNVLECANSATRTVGPMYDRTTVAIVMCERPAFQDAPSDPHSAVAAVLLFYVAVLLMILKDNR